MGRKIKNTVLLVSLILNFTFISIVISPYVAKIYYQATFEGIDKKTDINLVEKKVSKAVIRVLNEKSASDESVIYYHTMEDFLRHTLKGRLFDASKYGEFGYALYYTYKYAQIKDDKELKKYVKEQVNNRVLTNGEFEIERVDQYSYGCLFLELDKEWPNKIYKKAAEKIYKHALNIFEKSGQLLYANGYHDMQVDAIGLGIPFLYLYAQDNPSSKAEEIADTTMHRFIRYGIDRVTGLPAQGYNIDSKIKTGFSCWGRGAAWLATGILFMKHTVPEDSLVIDQFNKTLLKSNGVFCQYVGDTHSQPDMSATIPLLTYLIEKGLVQFTKEEIFDLLSSYIEDDGSIRFCSPSISRPFEKPNAFQTGMMVQSQLLYLLSIAK